MANSYRIIAASLKTLEVLDLIAGSFKAVSSTDIAETLDIKYDTVMCHISTLEKAGYIERFGDGYVTTLKMATYLARKKAQLDTAKREIEAKLESIGA